MNFGCAKNVKCFYDLLCTVRHMLMLFGDLSFLLLFFGDTENSMGVDALLLL